LHLYPYYHPQTIPNYHLLHEETKHQFPLQTQEMKEEVLK